MTHRNADLLSDAIDRWLRGESDALRSTMHGVAGALSGAFPEVEDQLARERVRRRLRAYHPEPRGPQEILLERAADNIERIARGVAGEEYVPWPALVGAAAVVVGAVVIAAYLRRRGVVEPVS